jgi:hypothetical protein
MILNDATVRACVNIDGFASISTWSYPDCYDICKREMEAPF